MKTARQRLVRGCRFIARFWPLWMIWAIIWLVPMSRNVAYRHTFGSIYDSRAPLSVREFWRGMTGNSDEEIVNPLPAAATHPRDLDLALWQTVWNSNGFYLRGRKNSGALDLNGLIKKFPDQIIAYAPALQDDLQIYAWSGKSYSGNSTSDNLRLRDLARRAHKLEPNNAAWLVAQAISASRRGDDAGTLKSLQSAAKCSFYDDKTLEIARRVLDAHARYGALQDYEKRVILDKLRSNNGNNWSTIRFFGNRAAWLRKSGKIQRALQWSAAMAKIGALLQRDPNSPATIDSGFQWQQQAWSLGLSRTRSNKTATSERFALYSISQGRADLAATARAQAKQSRAMTQLITNSSINGWDSWGASFWLNAGGLSGYLSLSEIIGFCLIGASCFLLSWWLVANLFLYRAGGVASSRAARAGLAIGVIVPLLALALASGWFFAFADTGPGALANPVRLARESLFGSLAVFSFVSAPSVLALIVALTTLWRHRRSFDLPPRVDTELALPAWARVLLRWFLPLAVVGTLICLIGGWVLWIAAFWNGWSLVDLLGFLPPDRNGVTGSLVWDIQSYPIMLIYGIFMCGVCLLIWFSKWRWATARDLRPFTHSALRWWKEALGASIVVLSWAYLLVALISWPVRQRADARFERVLKNGELSVLREFKSSDKHA